MSERFIENEARVSALIMYRHRADVSWERPRLPREVLEEAIKTLNLLFPIWDPATGRLLQSQKHRIRFDLDKPYGDSRALNVFEYDIWRDRLLELYEQVYTAPPASWKQLRKDKRNPAQYWTFWIALVILVLTIFATIASVVQAVYSVLAYYKQS